MGWEKKEPKIDHPKFSLAGFWKENCERKRRWEKLESKIEHPKFIIEGFWMENCVWKEKCMRKVGILDLTIQSSFLQLFEKEILKK